MRLILISTAALGFAIAPAAACSFGKAEMTMAERAPAVSTPAPTPAAPIEVALRDVWLERMIG